MRKILAILIGFIPGIVLAQASPTPVPSPSPTPVFTLNVQGRVSVDGSWYSGLADFKFALLDIDGNVRWTNDSNIPPTDEVELTCTDGVFSVSLGDTSYPNMVSIPRDIMLADDIIQFRTWFNDGTHGIQQLSDSYISESPYAVSSKYLESRYSQTLYVDGNRKDVYTEDGSFTKPFKTIKSAFLKATAMGASSSRRISIKVATGIYYEDNPISMINCVFLQGDFKHNPKIYPLDNDEPLFSAVAGDGYTSWRSCDFGDLTLMAPTNDAIWFFDTDTMPIVGLYQNLIWGTSENCFGVFNQNPSGGFHNVNNQSYGDYDIFARMDGGNWRDTGHISHFGNNTNCYLRMDGAGAHSEIDLIINNSQSVATMFDVGGDADTQCLVSNCVSYSVHTDVYVRAGTIRVNTCDFKGKTVVDGGNLSMSSSHVTTDNAGPIITINTPGEVSIMGSRLESTATGINSISFSNQPLALDISSTSVYTPDGYSIYSSVPLSGIFNSNYLQGGMSSNITNLATENWMIIQAQNALPAHVADSGIIAYDSNGCWWVSSTDSQWIKIWPTD